WAGVNRDIYPLHPDLAFLADGDSGYSGADRDFLSSHPPAIANRDSHPGSRGQRLAPAGLLRGSTQHLHPGLSKSELRIGVKQSPPVRIRLFPRRMRQLVDKGLQEEFVLRPSHRCPGATWDMRLLEVIIEELVCRPVGKLVQAPDGLLIPWIGFIHA